MFFGKETEAHSVWFCNVFAQFVVCFDGDEGYLELRESGLKSSSLDSKSPFSMGVLRPERKLEATGDVIVFVNVCHVCLVFLKRSV